MTPPPSLDDLIRTVQHDAATAEPLDQLATASATVAELTETTDAVLGHYVDRCRRSGHSWTEISGVLGVSKQAVHKRFSFSVGMPSYERFTDRARTVLEQASVMARELGHPYVGTEHLLLGLFAEPAGIAAKILAKHGITQTAAESAILKYTPKGEALVVDRPASLTPRLSKMLGAAVTEAVDMGHNYIGTEHLLLAFYRQPESLGTQVLLALNATQDVVRADVIEALSGFGKS